MKRTLLGTSSALAFVTLMALMPSASMAASTVEEMMYTQSNPDRQAELHAQEKAAIDRVTVRSSNGGAANKKEKPSFYSQKNSYNPAGDKSLIYQGGEHNNRDQTEALKKILSKAKDAGKKSPPVQQLPPEPQESPAEEYREVP
jgi:hypothetical protein